MFCLESEYLHSYTTNNVVETIKLNTIYLKLNIILTVLILLIHAYP